MFKKLSRIVKQILSLKISEDSNKMVKTSIAIDVSTNFNNEKLKLVERKIQNNWNLKVNLRLN